MNETREITAAGLTLAAGLVTRPGANILFVRCADWTGVEATLKASKDGTANSYEAVKNENGEAIVFNATTGSGQQGVMGGVWYALDLSGVPAAAVYFSDVHAQAT